MGQEDALRGWVYWLMELLDGNRLHRLVRSTHYLGAQALAITGVSISNPAFCTLSIFRIGYADPLQKRRVTSDHASSSVGVRLSPRLSASVYSLTARTLTAALGTSPSKP